jgi:peptide chain release factor 1
MLDKIAGIEQHYEQLGRELEEVGSDYQRAAEINKERVDLEPLINKASEYRKSLIRIEEAQGLLESETDDEMIALAQAEIEELEPKIEKLENEIKSMLVPKDPRDEKNVIVEIRAGTGGDEAALFAADLFRMYTRYAENKGWKSEILSQNEIGIGGFKEVIFEIKGRGAYSKLKYESGVHRVQRIPETESSGRIHTSTATVAVLAEVEDVDIDIPDSDLRIDVYKSAGAGGQSVQAEWWSHARTNVLNCRTKCAPCPFYAPASTRPRKRNDALNRKKHAAHRWGRVRGPKRSARTIIRRTASRIIVLASHPTTCPV